jgi:hypothetical protein
MLSKSVIAGILVGLSFYLPSYILVLDYQLSRTLIHVLYRDA